MSADQPLVAHDAVPDSRSAAARPLRSASRPVTIHSGPGQTAASWTRRGRADPPFTPPGLVVARSPATVTPSARTRWSTLPQVSSVARRPAFDVVWCAFAMPPSLCPRRLVFLLLVIGAGFLAPPAEAAKRPFADIIDNAARRHGVEVDLVHAVIAVESGYRATAQSPAGAQGLMQLMPGTQRDLGVSDAFDPRQNVAAGVAYLRRLTDEFGTVLALAAYNAGPGAVRRYNGIPPYEQTHAYVRAVLGRGRPAADVQEPKEEDPSGDPAHAGSEADLAEGAPAEPQLQDDHLAADGAAGLEPWALDEAAELDPAADTVRFVLHRGADRLTVDVEPGHDPERPVIAAMQASDPGAQRGHNRRPRSIDGRRDPTPGSGQRAPVGSSPTATARGADQPQPEPATCASAGLPRGRPGENLEAAAVPEPMNKHGGGHLNHSGTTGLDGVSATTATATSSSTRHTSRWSEPSSTGADIVVAAQAGRVLVRVDGPIEDVVDKLAARRPPDSPGPLPADHDGEPRHP